MHHGAGAVLQPVGQLGRQVEVLAAGAERGRRQDQVPHPPLVPLVQPLVDLVHAAEGDSGELLQGELQVVMLRSRSRTKTMPMLPCYITDDTTATDHVDRRGDAHLAPGLPPPGQLAPVLPVPEPHLDGHSVGLEVGHVFSAQTDL